MMLNSMFLIVMFGLNVNVIFVEMVLVDFVCCIIVFSIKISDMLSMLLKWVSMF